MHHVRQSNLVHRCEPKQEINKKLEIKLISIENKAQVFILRRQYSASAVLQILRKVHFFHPHITEFSDLLDLRGFDEKSDHEQVSN